MKNQNIIDVWMQHPTQRFINHDMFASLRRWMKIDRIEQDIPIQMTVATMDAANVSKSLLCAWYAPYGDLISNEEVHAWVQQYPDRFVGIASVPLNKPMQAIAELKKAVNEFGFKGLRIVQWVWNLPATHAYYYPLFAQCVELDIPVCLQVGHTGPLMPSEVGRPIPYIDQIALDFPELKIVCGHMGYPWTAEMIAVATKHRNVYIDTSAYTVKRFPPELVQFMKTNGSKKVLFGTNYPMITPDKCLQDLASIELTEEQSRNFLFENAKRVFRL